MTYIVLKAPLTLNQPINHFSTLTMLTVLLCNGEHLSTNSQKKVYWSVNFIRLVLNG